MDCPAAADSSGYIPPLNQHHQRLANPKGRSVKITVSFLFVLSFYEDSQRMRLMPAALPASSRILHSAAPATIHASR